MDTLLADRTNDSENGRYSRRLYRVTVWGKLLRHRPSPPTRFRGRLEFQEQHRILLIAVVSRSVVQYKVDRVHRIVREFLPENILCELTLQGGEPELVVLIVT